eukprot:gb/GEZN01002350.1/.p1 GENE.gb/GEZN01002350.1/~~gb/GEZN01002350.1/.p1  ORF type:complete len:716 (+),score=98.32 gb/GEZN01002350.1/:96-2243(+)
MMSAPSFVTRWLISNNLGQYAETFQQEGFEELLELSQITEEDLEAMGVKRGHKRRLMALIQQGLPTPESTAKEKEHEATEILFAAKQEQPSADLDAQIKDAPKPAPQPGFIDGQVAEGVGSNCLNKRTICTEHQEAKTVEALLTAKTAEALPTAKSVSASGVISNSAVVVTASGTISGSAGPAVAASPDISALSAAPAIPKCCLFCQATDYQPYVFPLEKSSAELCRFLLKGGCRKGTNCNFRHTTESGLSNVSTCKSCAHKEIGCYFCGLTSTVAAGLFSVSQLRKYPRAKCVNCVLLLRRASTQDGVSKIKVGQMLLEGHVHPRNTECSRAPDPSRAAMYLTQAAKLGFKEAFPLLRSVQVMAQDVKAPPASSNYLTEVTRVGSSDSNGWHLVAKKPKRQARLPTEDLTPTQAYDTSKSKCKCCQLSLSRTAFSNTQNMKPEGTRHCIRCIQTTISCGFCKKNKALIHYTASQRAKPGSKCRVCGELFLNSSKDVNACYKIGQVYLSGIPGEAAEPDLAAFYLGRAAQQGHAHSLQLLKQAMAMPSLTTDARSAAALVVALCEATESKAQEGVVEVGQGGGGEAQLQAAIDQPHKAWAQALPTGYTSTGECFNCGKDHMLQRCSAPCSLHPESKAPHLGKDCRNLLSKIPGYDAAMKHKGGGSRGVKDKEWQAGEAQPQLRDYRLAVLLANSLHLDEELEEEEALQPGTYRKF